MTSSNCCVHTKIKMLQKIYREGRGLNGRTNTSRNAEISWTAAIHGCDALPKGLTFGGQKTFFEFSSLPLSCPGSGSLSSRPTSTSVIQLKILQMRRRKAVWEYGGYEGPGCESNSTWEINQQNEDSSTFSTGWCEWVHSIFQAAHWQVYNGLWKWALLWYSHILHQQGPLGIWLCHIMWQFQHKLPPLLRLGPAGI